MRAALLALAAILATLPVSAGADHDSGIRLVTSTDFDAAHPPVAGVPAELNYFALDGGVITGHHNAVLALRTGGADLARLPFTHEHDSIFNALVTPARAGPLSLDIQLPPLDTGAAGHPAGHEVPEGDLLAHGTILAEAVPLVAATTATLTVEGTLLAGAASPFTFRLAGSDGEPLTGYVLATFLTRAPAPEGQVFRQVKLAVKDGSAEVTLIGPPEGLELRATAWPSLWTGPMWAPIALEPLLLDAEQDPTGISVSPQVPALPAPPGMAAAPPAPQEEPHLYLALDPAPRNWVFQTTRANLIAMGAGMEPQRHVDFTVRVTDALGRVWFDTSSMHEVDGMAQVDFLFPFPGMYRLEASATPLGGEPLAVDRWFSIEGQGTNAQPSSALLEAPEALAVGEAAPLTLGLHYVATGESVPHTDYWLRILHEGIDVLQTKIHTHQGDATPEFAAPWPGTYEVRLLAYPQAGGLAAALRTATLTAEGELPPPGSDASPQSQEPPRAVPGPEALLIGAAVGLALTLRRRAA